MYDQMYGVFDPHVMNEVVELGDPMALSTPLLLVSTKKRGGGITVLYYSIGLPSRGSWKLHDPELKDLASHLPDTILHSRADSTVKKYLSAYRRWKKWAASHKLSVFPAKPHQFVLYLQYLGELTKSRSAVEEVAMPCHGSMRFVA